MSPPLLAFQGVSHIFPDGTAGLSDINCEISGGGMTILTGRNGAGKSLLMKHAIGLVRPSSGRILFRGKALTSNLSAARRELGYVFQDADSSFIGETVFADTAFGPSNLRLPRDEIISRVDRALRDVGLEGKREAIPLSLSGGEKRRLSIAGILAVESEAFILDEPFANLDYPSIRELLVVLLRLKEAGKTLIILTHELEKVLAHADRILVLEKGMLAYDGDPRSLESMDLAEWGLRNPFRPVRDFGDLSWLN